MTTENGDSRPLSRFHNCLGAVLMLGEHVYVGVNHRLNRRGLLCQVAPIIGQDVFFTATVTPRTVVVTKYEWVFGDGDELDTQANNTTQHSYSEAKAFTVTVTATTSDNETVATSALVTVRP